MLMLEQTSLDWQDLNPNIILTKVGTKHGGYQPLPGWYQLEKVNIIKCTNILDFLKQDFHFEFSSKIGLFQTGF